MRISRIEIKDFRQFKDFELDLTYPKGHEKEGEPLDKVCFIGQSGTGKTTLLDLIYMIIFDGQHGPPKFEVKVNHKVKLQLQTDEMPITITDPQTKSEEWDRKGSRESTDYLQSIDPKFNDLRNNIISNHWGIIYFPAESSNKKYESDSPKYAYDRNPKTHLFHSIFTLVNSEYSWNEIKTSVSSHQDEISKFRFRISKAIENGQIESSQKIAKELELWRENNPGILEDLAKNFLDPILSHFQLKIKTELDSLREADFLTITNQNGETIPDTIWSTGINNIIYKTLPLYTIKPTKHNIILIDEPENSLYPDIQAQIVEHYLHLAPESQFFFATHSPIVASSFEPWEIVELKFDEEGKVYREKYYEYEGENHVDNYFPDVRYLDYGQVLKNIFDLKQESGNQDNREEGQMELARLKSEIKQLNEAGNQAEAEKLFEEFQKVAKKLDWEISLK